MKKIIGAVIVLAVLGVAAVAYRAGWFTRPDSKSMEPAQAGDAARGAGGASAGGASAGGASAGGGIAGADAGRGAAEPPVDVAALMPDGNVATAALGARIESVTSDLGARWSVWRLIDGTADGAWSSKDIEYPQDIVLSFFRRQPVLISAIRARPGHVNYPSQFAKDVEIWTSVTSPSEGFARLCALTFEQKPDEQTVTVPPVEARFVKVRILSNHGHRNHVQFAGLKITEAQRQGYTPLLARSPELAAWATGRYPAVPAASASAAGATVAGDESCSPVSAASRGRSEPPRFPESRDVLVISEDAPDYPAWEYRASDKTPGVDFALYGRIRFSAVPPWSARPGMLAAPDGFDTVVLAQLCQIKKDLSDPFKQALMAWVGQGHKLIIQDSDECVSGAMPDYGFLPYRFATSNPGQQGGKSDLLFFVEENQLLTGRPEDPAFLDVESWLSSTRGSFNELGDSNTIYQYDGHWCGQLFGTNANKVNGFMLAYAHYGRGLIIYDGFDEDQRRGAAYRQLVTRELALGFDPDRLPCSVRLGDFVITTEQRLKALPMAPGRTYSYPLTLLSNQGYKGTVTLTLTSTPPEPGLSGSFEPTAVTLSDISRATLTLRTAATVPPTPHALAVRGMDASGTSRTLCLQLTERTTGGIQVVSELRRDRKPTRNLEIILDVSGSMKTALGKKTRWATALDVLDQVLRKLPDDFNVGMRLYGHREASTSPRTCTDSELVVPIAKLDRARLLAAARAVRPKGETPLVYSVLQTPADLKASGGGSVILITDGEESCKGDVKAAAQQVRGSGVDVTVNIVGFTLTGKQTAAQLTTLAEGTGGNYYAAQSGEALARALLIAAVEKFPYVITDAAGKVVAKGEAGGPPEELPAGDYTVAVTAGDQELKEKVTVAVGGDLTLRVRLQGDRFVIAR